MASTPLRVEVGTRWNGADGGHASDAGPLVAGSIRAWGVIEARGRPGTVTRGDELGHVTIGSIDTNEGSVWVTQNGNPPSDLNFALAGNGSSQCVNAGAQLFIGIQDTYGMYLRTVPPEVYPNAIPVVEVARRLDVGRDGIATDGGLQLLRSALPTCNAGLEGRLYVDVLSGASTGERTRLCLCSSDGAGAYALVDVSTGNVGTSTTCGPE